jgi:hypothetical protein
VIYLAASTWTGSPDLSFSESEGFIGMQGGRFELGVAHTLSKLFASLVKGTVLTSWPILPGM